MALVPGHDDGGPGRPGDVVQFGRPTRPRHRWLGSLLRSPDSRWLFVVTARGTLAVVDPRTGRSHDLGLGISGLSQIAIRPASG